MLPPSVPEQAEQPLSAEKSYSSTVLHKQRNFKIRCKTSYARDGVKTERIFAPVLLSVYSTLAAANSDG